MRIRNILPMVPQDEADTALLAPRACPSAFPPMTACVEESHLRDCEAMPALTCTATEDLESSVVTDFSSAYERLLALGQASQPRPPSDTKRNRLPQHETEFPLSHHDGSEAMAEGLSAHPDAQSLNPPPGNLLPFPINQLEHWASILTSEATLHEGRPGRAGLAASRLAWALGVPMRTARMLMAVSYTHLDVYKRQERGEAVAVFGNDVHVLLVETSAQEQRAFRGS